MYPPSGLIGSIDCTLCRAPYVKRSQDAFVGFDFKLQLEPLAALALGAPTKTPSATAAERPKARSFRGIAFIIVLSPL